MLHRIVVLTLAMLVFAQPVNARADVRDGAHDFDWEIGTWTTHVRLRPPLSNADDWSEFSGTSTIVALSQGRANCVQLSVAHGDRRLEGVSLRLYNPTTHQWSLNFANLRNGVLTSPDLGSFIDGRGIFIGHDSVNGADVLVRFVITEPDTRTAHFEQAYSADNGRTWIINWIATDVRAS